MYRAVTHDIEVSVEPFYLEEQSDPEDGRYVWGYRVTIDNHSDDFGAAPVALLAHHRRQWPGRGGSRSGRRRRAAGARSRRLLSIYRPAAR